MFWIIFLIIVGILLIGVIVLYFLGKKMEKKQAEQQEQMAAVAQTVSMLVIDKKKMPIREAGFPAAVMESVPKRMRRSKVFVVKGKIGPKVLPLMCDTQIYPLIPLKKEIKATISGIYITNVKGVRGALEQPEKKKKGLFRKKS